MNFNFRIKELESEHARLGERLAALKTQLEQATDFTTAFLEKCARAGINKVGIERTLPSSHWPFGSSGSVFTFENERDNNGWPAIWGVCEALKIDSGAGNTDQRQISGEAQQKLISGLYELREGKWKRIEEPA